MIRASVFAAAAMVLAQPASAATPLVSNGQLVGATNLLIDGASYKLEIVEGTCAQVYGSCDSNAAFTFKTHAASTLAARAIVGQVLLDGSLGNFRSDYTKTFGCQANDTFFAGGACVILVPHSLVGTTVLSQGAFNADIFGGEGIASSTTGLSFDSTSAPWAVWARFSATPVPEPASWALMIAGFGLVGAAVRRQPRPSLSPA